ncbi:hypothetical protein DFH09DRAFT_1334652 [Mycena vulgaris]|nr:hypothetical protein DFH09DRAFT_1334652 [Mycena vulgaris]
MRVCKAGLVDGLSPHHLRRPRHAARRTSTPAQAQGVASAPSSVYLRPPKAARAHRTVHAALVQARIFHRATASARSQCYATPRTAGPWRSHTCTPNRHRVVHRASVRVRGAGFVPDSPPASPRARARIIRA